VGKTVTAVSLDRLVERFERGLRGGELRDIGGLAGVFAASKSSALRTVAIRLSSTAMCASASGWAMPWWAPIGVDQTWRCLA